VCNSIVSMRMGWGGGRFNTTTGMVVLTGRGGLQKKCDAFIYIVVVLCIKLLLFILL